MLGVTKTSNIPSTYKRIMQGHNIWNIWKQKRKSVQKTFGFSMVKLEWFTRLASFEKWHQRSRSSRSCHYNMCPSVCNHSSNMSFLFTFFSFFRRLALLNHHIQSHQRLEVAFLVSQLPQCVWVYPGSFAARSIISGKIEWLPDRSRIWSPTNPSLVMALRGGQGRGRVECFPLALMPSASWFPSKVTTSFW